MSDQSTGNSEEEVSNNGDGEIVSDMVASAGTVSGHAGTAGSRIRSIIYYHSDILSRIYLQ